MEEWKNYKKQKPPGAGPAANSARTERLVAEMRANLTKRKVAARGRDGDPKADPKVDSKSADKPKVSR